MRAVTVCFAALLVAGCSDSTGPESIDLQVTVTWDRMNEAGFVADRWEIFSWEFGGEQPNTLASGTIPTTGSPFVISARLTCPIPGFIPRLQVWGRYQGRAAETACHGVGWFDDDLSGCEIDNTTVTVGFTDTHPGFEQPTDGPLGVGCTPPNG